MLRRLGGSTPAVPLFLTIPHSGEEIPAGCDWLRALPERVLLTDVDRFVDRLYIPAIEKHGLPAVLTRAHRYAADLNRFPDDVDAASVEDAPLPAGTHTKGFHWVESTRGDRILARPIPRALHDRLVRECHDAFHEEVRRTIEQTRAPHPAGPIFHLDCHSMPSVGTGAHADSGKPRPDAVISDFDGASCDPRFKDLVLGAYEAEGFRCTYNVPYKGGRITQRYGQPAQGHHTIQVELNRALYMDEETRRPHRAFDEMTGRLERALSRIIEGLQVWT